MSQTLRVPARWRIVATFRKPDGSVRVEDLGVHEALVGRKAKARALMFHAGRMGWRMGKRGPVTTGWSFKISLEKP